MTDQPTNSQDTEKDLSDDESGDKKGIRQIGRCFEIKEEKISGDSKVDTVREICVHYYIELLESGSIALEKVAASGEPTGQIIENLTKEDFTKQYMPCSHHKCALKPRTVDEIAKKMAQNRANLGENHLENDEIDQAEAMFNRALKYDEENLEANLGVGKIFLERENIDEAMRVFKEISESNKIYEQANKHTFNEFGIYLRKKEIYGLAIENYEKAITIDPSDECLYFNLATAYKANGELQSALDTMKETLDVAESQKENPEKEKIYLDSVISGAKAALDLYMKEESENLVNLFGEDSKNG